MNLRHINRELWLLTVKGQDHFKCYWGNYFSQTVLFKKWLLNKPQHKFLPFFYCLPTNFTPIYNILYTVYAAMCQTSILRVFRMCGTNLCEPPEPRVSPEDFDWWNSRRSSLLLESELQARQDWHLGRKQKKKHSYLLRFPHSMNERR